MKELKEIKDDQIRIIGEKDNKRPYLRGMWIVIAIIGVLSVVGVIVFAILGREETTQAEPEPVYFEPVAKLQPLKQEWIGSKVDSVAK